MAHISLVALALSLVPVAGVAWIGWAWAKKGTGLVVATLRMLAQLLAVGFVLVFLFENPNPFLGLAIVGVMIAASSAIAVRTVSTERLAAFWKASVGIGVAGSLVLAFILFVVLRLGDPAYQPRVMIPLAGMAFSNAMTAITLAAERLERELSIGATFEDARAAAWSAALIPQVNALLAVGIVSLPGMMTGQILSGVDPLIAVRYQIVVMALILQAAGYSVALFLYLSRSARR